MFSSIFLTKNQKLVNKWTKEHEQMILLANKLLAEHAKNNHKKAKKLLQKFTDITVDHVTDENIEFFKLLRDEDNLSIRSKKSTEEFVSTFKETQRSLIQFLSKYNKAHKVLDKEFLDTLTQIIDILHERIKYEEENLYELLYHGKKIDAAWAQNKKGFY